MPEPVSDALVFFGATGDLASKMIFPALKGLCRRGLLDMPVIGVAKSGLDLEGFKGLVRKSLEAHGEFDADLFHRLAERLSYIDGDYQDPSTFESIRQQLGKAEHPIHYLAIPPALFEEVVNQLGKSGCARGGRVVVEKPFGHDLATAKKLNKVLLATFESASVFRIDHYLGKRAVENLHYFRSANPIFESVLNHHHVESVQITMAEKFSVDDRGAFYDANGAIRDVIQNHMLQTLACLATELPTGSGVEPIREEKAKILASIPPIESGSVILGQFQGYREIKGVKPESKRETYAAIRLEVLTDRWQGVPFYLRTGKCLPETCTEVYLTLRESKAPQGQASGSNYLRFRLTPNFEIGLGVQVMGPDADLVGESVEMNLESESDPSEITPYERLFEEAMKGSQTLFAREDHVESAWKIVDPALDGVFPLQTYEKGTWGPSDADQLFRGVGKWHDPIMK